jgi:uncharacterized membrane protein
LAAPVSSQHFGLISRSAGQAYFLLIRTEDIMIQARNIRTMLVHPPLIATGATLLMAAFVTDLAYWRTLDTQWENFSIWLIPGGLVFAGLAGLALLAEHYLDRMQAVVWWRFALLAATALLSLLNAFVHSRDAYTAVVPEGVALSAIVTALLLVDGWFGWSLRARPQSIPSLQGKASS